MNWEEAETLLNRRLSKPSSRNVRSIVDILIKLEPHVLESYAIPYLVERFRDWPATVRRDVPTDLRDRVQELCAEVPLFRVFSPVDFGLIPDTEWSADPIELGIQLNEFGVRAVSLRCTADEFEFLVGQRPSADRPYVHHGDLTLTDGVLMDDVVVTGTFSIDVPEVVASTSLHPPPPPVPLSRKEHAAADLTAARWVDVEEIVPYLETPPFSEHRGYFDDVLFGTDFSEALIISGDVTIDGDFNRRWLEQFRDDPRVTVIVVDGNLEVSGDVESAYGGRAGNVCLIVLGDVLCQQFHCGGTYMVAVAGTTHCKVGVNSTNDHCPLFFADLRTPVAMMDEYWLMGGTENVGIVACRQDAGPGSEWPDLNNRISEVFAPELIDKSGCLENYTVLEWISEGRDVRRPPTDG